MAGSTIPAFDLPTLKVWHMAEHREFHKRQAMMATQGDNLTVQPGLTDVEFQTEVECTYSTMQCALQLH